jgi:hypothetical protein
VVVQLEGQDPSYLLLATSKDSHTGGFGMTSCSNDLAVARIGQPAGA